MGQMPGLKKQKPLLKIQLKVMFRSNMSACKKIEKESLLECEGRKTPRQADTE